LQAARTLLLDAFAAIKMALTTGADYWRATDEGGRNHECILHEMNTYNVKFLLVNMTAMRTMRFGPLAMLQESLGVNYGAHVDFMNRMWGTTHTDVHPVPAAVSDTLILYMAKVAGMGHITIDTVDNYEYNTVLDMFRRITKYLEPEPEPELELEFEEADLELDDFEFEQAELELEAPEVIVIDE
jgi:hypothetical protein